MSLIINCRNSSMEAPSIDNCIQNLYSSTPWNQMCKKKKKKKKVQYSNSCFIRRHTGWKIFIFFFPLGLVAFSILPLIPRSSEAFSSVVAAKVLDAVVRPVSVLRRPATGRLPFSAAAVEEPDLEICPFCV